MASSNRGLSSKRIEIIDALRGFSLAGIVIVHLVENYISAALPESFNNAVHVGVADYIVDGIIVFLLRGKFFALFSFLFGLSFFIQMDNANKKGRYFGSRFVWRLLLLMAIGFLHSLFYRGDILTVYAMLGIFLVPFYRISNKWILAVVVLLFLGLGRFVFFYFTKGVQLFGNTGLTPNAPELIAYYDILKNGSLFEVFATNATEGHLNKLDFQFGIFGRGYLTFGFFLLGLLIGRIRLFESFRERPKFLKRILLWSIAVFFVSIVLTGLAFISLGEVVTFDSWIAMLALTAVDLNNIAMTFIIVCLFFMFYKKTKSGKWLSSFAPYGRMALTNYFFQTVLGTFLLYGWGLGLIGELRNLYTFGMAFLIIAVQMWASKWWLKKFAYGPLEWLWRSATFFKWHPLDRR
ncbi:MAG: DUF418 domain-containing protein [Bacteroidota bacterium]